MFKIRCLRPYAFKYSLFKYLLLYSCSYFTRTVTSLISFKVRYASPSYHDGTAKRSVVNAVYVQIIFPLFDKKRTRVLHVWNIIQRKKFFTIYTSDF